MAPVDPDSPEYVYAQVAALIERDIESGRLPAGARLASERALAQEYGVSYMTVRRAVAVLRERGLLRTVHGRGTFVVRRDPEG